jgi:hypothetical protein
MKKNNDILINEKCPSLEDILNLLIADIAYTISNLHFTTNKKGLVTLLLPECNLRKNMLESLLFS